MPTVNNDSCRRYNPAFRSDRIELAKALEAMLDTSGFEEIAHRGEDVYERAHHRDSSVRVRVYTSIRHGGARACGADAIRVCLIWVGPNGQVRGLGSDRRVNRVGTVEDIVGRTLERMRNQYKKVSTLERCSSCGTPKFKSKKGNMVCAAVCWSRWTPRV